MLGWDFWHEETLLTLVSLRSPQVRKFRTLTELIMDAEEHVKNPYKGKKLKVKPRGGNGGGQQKGDGPWLGVPWEPCRARLAPCPRPEAAPWPRALGSGQIWGRLDVARRGARSLRPSLAPGTPGPVPSRAARGHRCCVGGSLCHLFASVSPLCSQL